MRPGRKGGSIGKPVAFCALIDDRQHFRIAIEREQFFGHAAHRFDSFGMIWAQLRLAQDERFFEEFECIGVAAEGRIADPQLVHARERRGMARAELGLARASVCSLSFAASACRPR